MISLVIQAGGRSSRMGQDKGLVPLRGKPMVEHAIEALAPLADETVITTNSPEGYRYLGIPLVATLHIGSTSTLVLYMRFYSFG